MVVPLHTYELLLVVASATDLLGQTDAREIIRRAVAADERKRRISGTSRAPFRDKAQPPILSRLRLPT